MIWAKGSYRALKTFLRYMMCFTSSKTLTISLKLAKMKKYIIHNIHMISQESDDIIDHNVNMILSYRPAVIGTSLEMTAFENDMIQEYL